MCLTCFVLLSPPFCVQHELNAIRHQYPFEPLQYEEKARVISFPDAIKLLRGAGVKTGDLEDFSTPNEKLLGKLVKDKFKTDFYIVDRYPLVARPFYTMIDAKDPNYTNSYDVFLRGEEITSGAQRIHDVTLLKQRAAACGIPESNIKHYVESFKYGAYPHGGAGIGLERVVMLYLGLDNIRKSSLFPRDPHRYEP
jgi:aspartyl-tRNA synthetase